MRSRRLLMALVLGCATPVPAMADVRSIDPDETTGTSLAVVVDDVPLAHTGQVLPLDAQGNLVGKDRPAEQVAQVLDNLAAALAGAGADFTSLVKVSVYAARTPVVDEVK